ncbi:hypothetical protein [Arcanobacterium haemolyticum]
MTTPMTVSDLRTKRADIWEKAKAFLDERRDADLAKATKMPLTSMPGVSSDNDEVKPTAPRATAAMSVSKLIPDFTITR